MRLKTTHLQIRILFEPVVIKMLECYLTIIVRRVRTLVRSYRSERALERQRQMKTAVLDILRETASVSALCREFCRRLIDTRPYALAWIGASAGNGYPQPKASAGHVGYLDAIIDGAEPGRTDPGDVTVAKQAPRGTDFVAIGHLSANGDGGLSTLVVSDPLTRALAPRGPFSWEPVARVVAGPVLYLFSPLNVLVGVVLGVLVALNGAVALVSYRAPVACGIERSAGVFAAGHQLLRDDSDAVPQLKLTANRGHVIGLDRRSSMQVTPEACEEGSAEHNGVSTPDHPSRRGGSLSFLLARGTG
jgi:hypothetical protein